MNWWMCSRRIKALGTGRRSKGNPYAQAISAEEVADARQGRWRIHLSDTKPEGDLHAAMSPSGPKDWINVNVVPSERVLEVRSLEIRPKPDGRGSTYQPTRRVANFPTTSPAGPWATAERPALPRAELRMRLGRRPLSWSSLGLVSLERWTSF
jgi:hypothetical protein